jgi:hypothetical protein
MVIKYPKCLTIFQMTTKHIIISLFKAPKNLPQVGIFGLKINHLATPINLPKLNGWFDRSERQRVWGVAISQIWEQPDKRIRVLKIGRQMTRGDQQVNLSAMTGAKRDAKEFEAPAEWPDWANFCHSGIVYFGRFSINNSPHF